MRTRNFFSIVLNVTAILSMLTATGLAYGVGSAALLVIACVNAASLAITIPALRNSL